MNQDPPLSSWQYYTRPISPSDPRSLLFYIDLDFQNRAPVLTHPVTAYVQVGLQKPDAAGQASADEAQILREIEAQLAEGFERISPAGPALYVGRVVGDGVCTFYYYLSAAHGVKKFIATLATSFSGYAIVGGTKSDAPWSVYAQMLPDRLTALRIQSRRQCFSFEQAGDTLKEYRPVQHWAVFPTDKARQSFIHSTMLLDFKTGYKSDSADIFGIQVQRDDIPSSQNMDALTVRMYELAESLGGAYEGWQTIQLQDIKDKA
jgi:hypothetical protein